MTIKSPQTDGELAIKFIREYHRQNPKASRANARGALSALLSTINHSHPKTVAEFNRQLDGLYG